MHSPSNSQIFLESLQHSVSNHFGDYQVSHIINNGSFGHIFKITQRKQSKKVYALKVLDRSRLQQSKIKNQINIHQSLKNRYILRCNNKFHDNQNFYMVLQYCSNGDLSSYMNKNYQNGMPLLQIQKFTQQISKGINYLHKQNIVHCDIKPSNILIDNNQQIKICDFGLSNKLKQNQRIKGAKGTLNYLAPQCIYPYDYSIDVWSLGVLIYYLLTNRLPFDIKNYKQLTQILNEDNISKIQYPKNTSQKLLDLFKHIFVFNPENRYTIKQVLKHPFLTGQPLQIKQEDSSLKKQITQKIPIQSHASNTLDNFISHKTQLNIQSNQLKRQKSKHIKQRYSSKTLRVQSCELRGKQQSSRIKKTSTTKSIKQHSERNPIDKRILAKKSYRSDSQFLNENKQNYLNYANQKYKKTSDSNNNTAKIVSTHNSRRQSPVVEKCTMNATIKKRQFSPLNTQNMIIKPIVEKNTITKINQQGIIQQRQQIGENSIKKIKQMRISPNGQAIFMKLDKVQKFYTLDTLPQKHYDRYLNCKRIVNSVKNYTAKLQFNKKASTQSKQTLLRVMYNGKIHAQISGTKIQTTQQELESLQSQFGVNILDKKLKYQVKRLIQKLKAL